jgi:hypothetical protein
MPAALLTLEHRGTSLKRATPAEYHTLHIALLVPARMLTAYISNTFITPATFNRTMLKTLPQLHACCAPLAQW